MSEYEIAIQLKKTNPEDEYYTLTVTSITKDQGVAMLELLAQEFGPEDENDITLLVDGKVNEEWKDKGNG